MLTHKSAPGELRNILFGFHFPRVSPLLAVLFLALGCSPSEVSVSLSVPAVVSPGDELEISVEITNSADYPQKIVSIDFSDSYLEGIMLTGSDPASLESSHVPLINIVSYDFGFEIGPNKSKAIVFKAIALEAGDYSGDLDVCINNDVSCIYGHARSVVKEPAQLY